jgi:hypothetical protein
MVFLIFNGNTAFQFLIFSLWGFIHIFKSSIQSIVNKINFINPFLILSIALGLITELLAILTNIGIPYGQRILLHQNFIIDFVFALIYYPFFMFILYLLLRRYDFSKIKVFFIFGIFGIFTEEVGDVLLRLIFGFDIVYATLVLFVYGLFPYLAYSFTKNRFDTLQRKKGGISSFAISLIVLLISYAIYGNTIYPLLTSIFPQ